MRIGLVGLGNMGRPMAARIRAAGFELVVFDARDDVARTVAAACGATAADSLATLAAHSDAVVTMLPDGAAVRRVALGPGDRLLDGLTPGALVVDMGSSSPTGTRALGAELGKHGVGLVDAPVSGGVRRASDGTLSIMVGGDPALVARCTPLFHAVGERIFECGGLGSGHAMKALNNLVSAAGLLAAAEALVVGRRFGLDPTRMLEVLNASTGRNYATEQKLAQFVLSRRFDAGFSLALMVKDLGTALDLAHETHTPAPLAAKCRALWTRAAAALEPDADHTAIVRWLETLADVTLEAPRG
ncbi:MAG TPA: NAD(P)-dependent oxidoreductase [Candidatus Binatia bacterium]|nr:NAD(P)-dependent oxidoreductase [Candidatus Binatia bacterium]